MEYSATVYTGSVDNAGTDADVYMTMYGKNGNSGTKLLDKRGKDDFEKGSQDSYKLKSVDLGPLQKVKVWHDGSGLASDWFLDKVSVMFLQFFVTTKSKSQSICVLLSDCGQQR